MANRGERELERVRALAHKRWGQEKDSVGSQAADDADYWKKRAQIPQRWASTAGGVVAGGRPGEQLDA